jgi:hypothetical protein
MEDAAYSRDLVATDFTIFNCRALLHVLFQKDWPILAPITMAWHAVVGAIV